MKKLKYYIFLLLLPAFFACQGNDESITGNVGYLRLEVSSNSSANTKANEEVPYNPKQIAVKILNSSGTVVKEVEDWTTISGEKIALSPGQYTIKASSAGFDGKTAAFDKPYYAGEKLITVMKNEDVTANIECTLANVKVTVIFSEAFQLAFQSGALQVRDTEKTLTGLNFLLANASTLQPAYFPVTPLCWELTVTNKNNVSNTQRDTIWTVEARDHFILNFKVAESNNGHGNITITVDPTTREYTYDIGVPVVLPGLVLTTTRANAWASFANLEGSIESKTGIEPDKAVFKYRKFGDETGSWQEIIAVATGEANLYTAKITGLTASTDYEYYISYDNGVLNGEGESKSFTTEAGDKIPNLGFDNWHKDGKTWYICLQSDFSNGSFFWDSGNKGANTLKEVNPTAPEYTDVHTAGEGRAAASLASTTAAGQFAAGSLYTGKFGSATVIPLGAKLNFGQPYANRPTQLTGWYKYNPGLITHTKKDFIAKNDVDSCSIYIALTDWDAPFAVSTGDNKFIDFVNDQHIIAYGELSKNEMCPTGGMAAYEQFTIDLKYRDLSRKPKHILIVCSASKYGDYFTGSTNSKLLVDDFDLLFEEEPQTDPNYIQ